MFTTQVSPTKQNEPTTSDLDKAEDATHSIKNEFMTAIVAAVPRSIFNTGKLQPPIEHTITT